MVELGKALNTLTDPPIKALYVYNSNPAAVCPNHNDVIRGLRRPDLFTAVHEQFFTDTTDYADIVLPATTFFEQKDLQTAYGHYYIQMSNQAIEPLGECRSNVETFRGLAKAMGFEDECFSESVDEMIDTALSSANPWLKGINREVMEREGHRRLNFEGKERTEHHYRHVEPHPFLPFANGGFQTPSGKAELYNPALIAQGLDPVAEFVPPRESRHTTDESSLPLELLARNVGKRRSLNVTSTPTQDVTNLDDYAEGTRGTFAQGDRVVTPIQKIVVNGEPEEAGKVDLAASGSLPAASMTCWAR